jgi:osomolarity two-component system sensor histidine kinase SLN1
MRIPIREQVAFLILLSALIGLTVISVATWITNHAFVLNVRSSRLSLTAALKAAQLTSNLNVMQTSANFISSRVLVQSALMRYEQQGNDSAANWSRAQEDMQAAIGGGGSLGQSLLLQSMVFPKNGSGPNGPYSVLNTTSGDLAGSLPLPLYNENGSQVMLGDAGLGYPPALYPNLTFFEETYNSTFRQAEAVYNGDILSISTPDLLLGPWLVNDTFAMVSLTMVSAAAILLIQSVANTVHSLS